MIPVKDEPKVVKILATVRDRKLKDSPPRFHRYITIPVEDWEQFPVGCKVNVEFVCESFDSFERENKEREKIYQEMREIKERKKEVKRAKARAYWERRRDEELKRLQEDEEYYQIKNGVKSDGNPIFFK